MGEPARQHGFPWPWMFLFGVMFFLCLPMSVRVEDDAWFATVFFGQLKGDLGAFLAHRYQTWSTRLLLETLMLPLLRWGALFKLMFPLWMAAIAAAVSELLTLQDNKARWCVALSLLLIPLPIYSRAGYVCSTINYVATLACFLWAILPTVRRGRGRNVTWWQDAGALLLMVIACNMEFYCIPFLLVSLLLFFRGCRHKRFDWRALLLAAIALGGGWFGTHAPVSTVTAYANSAKDLFPGFNTLGMAQKLVIAVNSTAGGLISRYEYGDSFLVPMLVIGSLLAVWGWRNAKRWEMPIWCFPLVLALGVGIPAGLAPPESAMSTLFRAASSGWAAPAVGGGREWHLPLALALLLFAALLWCAFRLSGALGVFTVAALLSRVSMAVSKSIYASGMRTFTLLLFVLCAMGAMAASDLGPLSLSHRTPRAGSSGGRQSTRTGTITMKRPFYVCWH